MSASEEINGRVARVLVEALNVDEDEVTPAATLRGDLGAESIDLLDIVFRLEREFDIKILRGELFPDALFQGDPDFVHDGRVTPRGIAELRARLPFADLSRFEQAPQVGNVMDVFTVDMLTRYLRWKLAAAAVPKGL